MFVFQVQKSQLELDRSVFSQHYASSIGAFWVYFYGENGAKFGKSFSDNLYNVLVGKSGSAMLYATPEQANSLKAFVANFNRPFGASVLTFSASKSDREDEYSSVCTFALSSSVSPSQLNYYYSLLAPKKEPSPQAAQEKEEKKPAQKKEEPQQKKEVQKKPSAKQPQAEPEKEEKKPSPKKEEAAPAQKKKEIAPPAQKRKETLQIQMEFEENLKFSMHPRDQNLSIRIGEAEYTLGMRQAQSCKIAFKGFNPSAEEIAETNRIISQHLDGAKRQIGQFSDAERVLRGSASMEAVITGERAKIYADPAFGRFLPLFVNSVWAEGLTAQNRLQLAGYLRTAMQSSSDPAARAALTDENLNAVLNYAYTHYRNVRVAFKRLELLGGAISRDVAVANKVDLSGLQVPSPESVLNAMLGEGESQIYVSPALTPASGAKGIASYRAALAALSADIMRLGGRGVLESWAANGWAGFDQQTGSFSISWGMGANPEAALTAALISRGPGPVEEAFSKHRTTGITLAQDGEVKVVPNFAEQGYSEDGFSFTYSTSAKTNRGNKDILVEPQVSFKLWRVDADENGKPILENGKVKKTEVRLYDKNASQEYNATASAWTKTEGNKVKVIPLSWNSSKKEFEVSSLEPGLYQVDIDAALVSYDENNAPRTDVVRGSVRVNIESQLVPQPMPLQFERISTPSGPYGDHEFELKTPVMKVPPLYTRFAPALGADVALLAVFYDRASSRFMLIPPRSEGELDGMETKPGNVPLEFRNGALYFAGTSGKSYQLCTVDMSNRSEPAFNFEKTLSPGSQELKILQAGGYISMRRVGAFGDEESPTINIGNEEGDELGNVVSVYAPSAGTVTIAGKIYPPAQKGRGKK